MTFALASTTPPRLFALVPCAGVGERAGAAGAKQYALLAGRSLVAHTLTALQAVMRLNGTLVVLSPEDTSFEAAAPDFEGWVAREGGATRAQTVANGLQALVAHGASPDDWVLVHDAARCLVRAEWIDTLIDACLPDACGGLLALPVADTLKSEQGGFVKATVDRRAMWQAQTPQMFRIGPLQAALAQAGAGVTDEASAMEAVGQAPRLVAGSLENFKVTWPADFDLAERLLRTRT
jgi:2-C-methyl-D-erythritol 4-phosphate cytidylyltransferase